jgi:formate hydrogenlyase subunit 3/multisubunit Na+/H+ antiporter MnhD subunit
MSIAAMSLVIAPAAPFAMLAACLSRRLRDRMPSLLALAPLPALAVALLAPDGTVLSLPPAAFRLTFAIDSPAAMLLGASALLWVAAGVFAGVELREKPNGGRFAIWWLTTLTGNLGIFIAADLVSFYVFFTLVSLAAYGLVAHDDSPLAKRAGAVYIALALFGEAILLMGFVVLAVNAPETNLLIRDAIAALPTSPARDIALALVILGFGLKIGLVPLHVWMPLAYSAAPIAAAAVLSGAAVKAGVIGLIRFLPFDTALPGWGDALATVGLFSAYFGVAIGITQANPKTVLAYSSVSQMGFLAAVLGMGLAAGDVGVSLAAAFYAVHHVLAKGGLFLALGCAEPERSRWLWLVLLPAAVLALGLGGLPLTGGALAKLSVKAPLGNGVAGMLATLSAIGSTLLMLHFLRCLTLRPSHEADSAAPAGLLLPWLTVAFAAVVVPWTLYPEIANARWQEAFALKEVWATLWPVFIGAFLSLALLRWGDRLPRVPQGDMLVAEERAVRRAFWLGAAMSQIDWHLRHWRVASMLFFALAILLAGIMLVGH